MADMLKELDAILGKTKRRSSGRNPNSTLQHTLNGTLGQLYLAHGALSSSVAQLERCIHKQPDKYAKLQKDLAAYKVTVQTGILPLIRTALTEHRAIEAAFKHHYVKPSRRKNHESK